MWGKTQYVSQQSLKHSIFMGDEDSEGVCPPELDTQPNIL